MIKMVHLFWLALLVGVSFGCLRGVNGEDPENLNDGHGDWQASGFAEEAGAHYGAIEFDDRSREFAIYIPQAAVDAGPQPLLFILHGGGGNMDRMRNIGFESLADRDGGILVYPQGVDERWADGRGTTEPELEGVDDVAFIAQLVELVERNLDIDSDRIGVTGASNGGMMSFRLACELDGILSMSAPVIAAMPSRLVDSCEPGQPPSLLGIQGTDDEFVTFEGGEVSHDRYPRLGEGGAIESAAETMTFWAHQLGCDGSPDVEVLPPVDESDPTEVERFIYRDCQGDRALNYYVVHGMGHAWPPYEPFAPRISGATSNQLNATDLIWEFFRHGDGHE